MNPIQAALVPNATDATAPGKASGFLFGKNGLDFGDLLDILNPLQHIPIVGNLYRKATGDEIGAAARVAGGALFGGPIGAGIAAVTAMIDRSQNPIIDLHPGDTPHDTAIAARAAATPVTTGPAAAAPAAAERPGGWMLNVAQVPQARAEALAAEVSAPTPATAAPSERPGGWLVNAALAGRLREAEVAAPAVATAHARAERPGGWMVNAAQAALLHETA